MKKILFFSIILVSFTFAKLKTYNLLANYDVCKFHKGKDQIQNVNDFDQLAGLVNYTVSTFPDKIFYSCKTGANTIGTRDIMFVSNHDVRYNTSTLDDTILAFYAGNIIVLPVFDME